MSKDAVATPIKSGAVYSLLLQRFSSLKLDAASIGRMLVEDTDAPDDTLLKFLDAVETIEAIHDRIDPDEPALTAAQRHTK